MRPLPIAARPEGGEHFSSAVSHGLADLWKALQLARGGQDAESSCAYRMSPSASGSQTTLDYSGHCSRRPSAKASCHCMTRSWEMACSASR